jgi:hypothetical protein
MSTVSQLFNVRPDGPTQAFLASAFWPGIPWRPNDFADFFRYFNDHIDDLKWPHGVVDETKFAARTFDELVAIIKELGDKRDSPREEALTSIKQLQVFRNKQQTDRQVLNSMALAAQLWLTIEVRMVDLPPYGPASGAVEYAVWGPKNTLADLCRQQFQISKFIPTAREARLDTGFNAMNLMHICGIKIAWTDNLFDHLHYDQSPVPRSWWRFWQYHGSGGTIRIYPHKFCLARHYETTNVYGNDLLEETMKSLDLLFPFGHDQTRDFLSQELHPFFLAEPTFPRTMDLGDFNFWRRKIVILYDAFNAPPSRVQQMWRDTRNPMQWWTFWLAVLITILTTVFGVISGYTSFQQVELAKQTYRLSVQQACGQNDLIQQMCPLR